jgi:hypothetical protein
MSGVIDIAGTIKYGCSFIAANAAGVSFTETER